MKFVKAIKEEQTLKFDSRTTVVVPLEGIVVSDEVANALANRCAVEISEAPAEETEIFGKAEESSDNSLPDVAKEIMPEPSPETETPTVESLINEPQA